MTQLQGSVALVTGASRGAGRAISAELGSAGATVYVTGRSVAGGPTTDLRNVFYDLSKHAVARLVFAMAEELREHGIASLAVAPGFMRTERVTEAFRRAGAAEALDGPGGPKETPTYLGRAVVALAADPRVLEKSGQVLEVGALAPEYGFTDVNGSQPAPFRMPGK